MDKKANNALIVIGVILIIFLVWGLVGANEAQSVGVTCDFGVGDTFCWKWHKNAIGRAGEALGDFFDR